VDKPYVNHPITNTKSRPTTAGLVPINFGQQHKPKAKPTQNKSKIKRRSLLLTFDF